MRVALTEDALQILIHDFNYEVFNFGETGGITLTKQVGRRLHVINLPYGEPDIPEDVLDHVFQHTDFAMEEFWSALDTYLQSDNQD